MANQTTSGTQVLLQRYCELYPIEVAGVIERMAVEDALRALKGVPPVDAAAVVERLTPDSSAAVLGGMDVKMFQEVVPAMDPQLAAALLARWPEHERANRLELLPDGLAEELGALATFPPNTAGSLMDPRVTAFKGDTTVGEVLNTLRALPERKIVDVFLVDSELHLSGAVSLQQLAVATPETELWSLVQTPPVFVETMTHKSDVVTLLESRGFASLPVVDHDKRLQGVIRHAELAQAAKENASADMLSMVGASREERALSKAGFAARKRFPWLIVNLGTTFLAAAVVGIFQGTIAKFTVLAVLLPVVAGQSGNSGAQALAVVMRGLALREIRVRHGFRVALKEASVGLINGILTGTVCALGIYVWSRSIGLSLIIGAALVISMVVAGLSGAVIPIILTVLRQDPAQSSSIIMTTVTDVVGLLSFLGLATLFAHMLEAG